MPTIDLNPAAWLANLINNMQKVEDERFAKAEADYQAAAAQWVANVTLSYQSGAPIVPFDKVLPSKEVFQAVSQSDPTFGSQPFTSHVVFDPALRAPIAPPNTITTGAYHNPFSTGAPAADAATGQFQAFVRDALGRLLSKTGA